MDMTNGNLFTALRAAFPADLDALAIETADGPGAPLRYSWRDLERGTAMLANLIGSRWSCRPIRASRCRWTRASRR